MGGTDIVAAIAGNAVGAAGNLSLTSVTASGDISAHDATATRELHVDGNTVLNGSLTVGGTNVLTALASKQAAYSIYIVELELCDRQHRNDHNRRPRRCVNRWRVAPTCEPRHHISCPARLVLGR